jgi:membrane protein YqaA with SNARE-associated domain
LSPKTRLTVLRILALVIVVAITVVAIIFREQAAKLEYYGYPGIFLTALLSNATVLMPAPGVAIVFAMGSVFNPVGVALAAGTGGAIGELTGYLAGFSGQAVIERMDIYIKISPYVKKYGALGVFILAAIPNPFFDLAGIAAGVLKMPILIFFISVWLGSLVKMFIIAYAGSISLNWLFPT